MIFVYGDIILDMLVHASEPIMYGSDSPGSIDFQGGGSAANFASWASWAGSKVHFAGKVGSDVPGSYLQGDLDRWGVETSFAVDPLKKSGKILVLVDGRGERTMITDRGVNLDFRFEDIPLDILKKSSHLHLTGYSLFGSWTLVETAEKAIAFASERGISISIDPSSYALLEDFGPVDFLDAVAGCDIIFPNLDEGRSLTGRNDPEDMVRLLGEKIPLVVLKLGPHGCLIGFRESLSTGGGHGGKNETDEGGFRLLRVGSSRVIDSPDSTGAGDAFAASFLTAYITGGKSCTETGLRAAAESASMTALECVRKHGGRPPLPSGFGEF
ncbi:MAG: carbohydrate kinase family protein [Spirochaetales bacterium]|nr:carbohydrate kinase family protein [Spirochaetales bacterium]MCF7938549.1 carbohydrate kinase family protein [Spirochaetales bacterium]